MASQGQKADEDSSGAGGADGADGADGGASPSAGSETEWVCIGHKSTFSSRTTVKVHNRQVTVLKVRRRSNTQAGGKAEVWTCIDSICYHAGGPLADGAIKGIGGRTCIQCPWHSYLIDVFSGEGLYMDLDRKYTSKGVRQRVHEVEIRGEHVYVKLNLVGNVGSDTYAYGPRFGKSEVNIPQFPEW